MAKQRLIKWVCVEAIADEELGGCAKWLVTIHGGRYAGVKMRSLHDVRVRITHPDQPSTRDLAERYEPTKRVSRLSKEIQKAIKRDMLKVHWPLGKDPKKDPYWALAASVGEAFELFGVDKGDKPQPEPKQDKPKTGKKVAFKKTSTAATPIDKPEN